MMDKEHEKLIEAMAAKIKERIEEHFYQTLRQLEKPAYKLKIVVSRTLLTEWLKLNKMLPAPWYWAIVDRLGEYNPVRGRGTRVFLYMPVSEEINRSIEPNLKVTRWGGNRARPKV